MLWPRGESAQEGNHIDSMWKESGKRRRKDEFTHETTKIYFVEKFLEPWPLTSDYKLEYCDQNQGTTNTETLTTGGSCECSICNDLQSCGTVLSQNTETKSKI